MSFHCDKIPTMRRLRLYFKINKSQTPESLAKRCKVNPSTIYRILKGTVPRLETIKAIEQGTNGFVSQSDW